MVEHEHKLQAVLNRLGLSHREVADGVGVTRPAVWQWASGMTSPSLQNLLVVLAYLQTHDPDLTFEDLFESRTAA